MNYTRISQVDLAGGALTLEKSSTGGVPQAGVEIRIDKKLSFNIDGKKVQWRTDVFRPATRSGTSWSNVSFVPLG